MRQALAYLVIAALAIAFGISWFAPLLEVRLDFVFWISGQEISIISTLQSLWAEDPILALLLSFLTLMAPMIKLIGAGLLVAGLLSPKVEGVLWQIGRFAMADVLLIAVYVALFKGVGAGSMLPHWGLWLYTSAVMGSLGLSLWVGRWHKGA